jgi:hypothetical protein
VLNIPHHVKKAKNMPTLAASAGIIFYYIFQLVELYVPEYLLA